MYQEVEWNNGIGDITTRLLCSKSSGSFNIVLDCNENSSILLDCQLIVSEKDFFDIQRMLDLGCIKQCNARIWVIGTVKEKMIGIFHYETTATSRTIT